MWLRFKQLSLSVEWVHCSRALVYGEVVGKLWQNLDRLTEHLCYLDEYQTGELSEKDIWQALQSIRIPLKHDLMKDMLSVYVADYFIS